MKPGTAKIQIGKNGLTQGTIELLKNIFKNYKQVRISLLKSASERKIIKEIAEKILIKLGKKYKAKIIGFTIIINKK